MSLWTRTNLPIQSHIHNFYEVGHVRLQYNIEPADDAHEPSGLSIAMDF